jgi:type IV pilus assembly protein PilM
MRPSRIQILSLEADQVCGAIFRKRKSAGLELLAFASVPHQGSPESSVSCLVCALGITGAVEAVLPGHLTLMKNVRTPAIAKEKYGKIAEFEASQCIPGAMGDVVWDHVVVADDGINLEMMIVAAKADVIATWCGAVAAAGLSLERISPASITLHRGFRYNYPELTEPVIFISVGTKSTEIVLVDGARHFFRTLALGDGCFRTDPASPPPASAEEMRHFRAKLSNEVAKSIAQIRIQTALVPTAVFLSAQPSLAASLTIELGEVLNLAVRPYDPLRRVGNSAARAKETPNPAGPILAALVGLAAAVTGDAGTLRMNLLPKTVRDERVILSRQPWWLAAAALFVLAIGPAFLHFRSEVAEARSAVAATDARLSFVRELTRRNDENFKQVEAARKRVEVLQKWTARRTAWTEFLADLQGRLASIDDAWLERLNVADVPVEPESKSEETSSSPGAIRVVVAGYLLDRNHPEATVSNEAGARVRQLIVKLAQSRFIERVEDEHFDHGTPGLLQFQLTLVAANGAPL